MYVPAQKYSKGHYRVKLLEPIALSDEYLMEDGKLSFDTLENVQEKRRFKISVSPAAWSCQPLVPRNGLKLSPNRRNRLSHRQLSAARHRWKS
jgi:hypothetical protein